MRSTPSRILRAHSGRCSSTQSTFGTCTASGAPRASWACVWALASWWPAWRWNFAPMYTYMSSSPLTYTCYYTSPSCGSEWPTSYQSAHVFMLFSHMHYYSNRTMISNLKNTKSGRHPCRLRGPISPHTILGEPWTSGEAGYLSPASHLLLRCSACR